MMNNFTFYSPTEFVFGKGVEHQTGELCLKSGATKVLIVYGGGSVVRSGLLSRVEESLQTAGLTFVALSGVQPNPTTTKVYEGISLCREHHVDFILAIGGGSVIDTAKAVAAGAFYDADFWDFYVGKAKLSSALKVGVVLTIPAAGSEGSGTSVITNADTAQKLGLRSPEHLKPLFAVMNPEVCYTLPPYQTACGIADMMAHIMERYFSNTTGVEVTDRLCESLLQAIIHEGPICLSSPNDYDARANIMWAGTMAHNGICGVGREEDWSTHFLEHEVSAVYDVAHGAGLAVLFPAWLRWMSKHHVDKVAQFAYRVWDVIPSENKERDALEGVQKLVNFFKSLGLPVNFRELGVPNPDIDRFIKGLSNTFGEFVGHYVPLKADDVREIYHLAL